MLWHSHLFSSPKPTNLTSWSPAASLQLALKQKHGNVPLEGLRVHHLTKAPRSPLWQCSGDFHLPKATQLISNRANTQNWGFSLGKPYLDSHTPPPSLHVSLLLSDALTNPGPNSASRTIHLGVLYITVTSKWA